MICRRLTAAKPEMRFTVKEPLHGGVQCWEWLIQILFLTLIPHSLSLLLLFLLLLSVSRFLPCRLADATVMWSTLRCSSHYSLMALLTPSLRRKWERVRAWKGWKKKQKKVGRGWVGEKIKVELGRETEKVRDFFFSQMKRTSMLKDWVEEHGECCGGGRGAWMVGWGSWTCKHLPDINRNHKQED